MKQFSLEEFKKNQNRKVVTRDGRNVRIICTDAKGDYPVIGLISSLDNEDYPWRFRMDGAILENEENENDLFFDVEKKEGYINLYRSKLGIASHQTSFGILSKEQAEREAAEYPDDFIATAKVTWEE